MRNSAMSTQATVTVTTTMVTFICQATSAASESNDSMSEETPDKRQINYVPFIIAMTWACACIGFEMYNACCRRQRRRPDEEYYHGPLIDEEIQAQARKRGKSELSCWNAGLEAN